MATSPELRTATTLIPNQELLVKQGLTEALCFNDSALTDRHYRTIPKDTTDIGVIRWGNEKSVFRQLDGDYAVCISMFEYVYTGGGIKNTILLTVLIDFSNTGNLYTDPDGRKFVIQKGTVKDESPRVTFRKLVWVKASDLFLGSTSQFDSIRLKEEQDQKDLLDKLLNGPGGGNGTGNGDPATGNGAKTVLSSTTKIILGVVFFFIAGIWLLVAYLKKKKRKKEEEARMTANESNNLILEESAS
jgi:preprotein translocase subunit SecG